jgi:hypothetical protein
MIHKGNKIIYALAKKQIMDCAQNLLVSRGYKAVYIREDTEYIGKYRRLPNIFGTTTEYNGLSSRQ